MEELRDNNGLTEEEFLTQYDATKYNRPSVTTDMVIFTVCTEESDSNRSLPEKELRVLLIKRGGHPFLGTWALPGGFVNGNESVDQAAIRELKEETNLDFAYMEQLYFWGDLNRDPRARCIFSSSYMSLIDSSKVKVQAGDDADEAQWFTVKDTVIKKEKVMTDDGFIQKKWIQIDLTNGENKLSGVVLITKTVRGSVVEYKRTVIKEEQHGIAFDHARLIQYGIERLRNKLEYTDIAFGLMPERFTLSELQRVYEVILNKTLYKMNFRKQVEKMVIGTGELQKGKAHKPAELFKFNPNWDENDNF